MQAVEGNETSSTTLAMRDDNLYVHGFMNQRGVWYGLVGDPIGTSACMLPPEYNPEPLHWGGIRYSRLLRARAYSEAVAKLAATDLGRGFAMHAVRRLSRFIQPDDVEVDGLMNTRLALAGLMFMVCESARTNPVLESFAGGWSTGTGFTKKLITDYGVLGGLEEIASDVGFKNNRKKDIRA
ncbi:ribosome-inactivating protein 9-like [Miscanthus floridulus]|uniref:ribosome-inactivating protein 9-like n=1 Tax=Miscanthus floridulus TaxID=154761 RepID=UPI00345A6C53